MACDSGNRSFVQEIDVEPTENRLFTVRAILVATLLT
jgi:hypothetical protein